MTDKPYKIVVRLPEVMRESSRAVGQEHAERSDY
jgi:hypothetical protein